MFHVEHWVLTEKMNAETRRRREDLCFGPFSRREKGPDRANRNSQRLHVSSRPTSSPYGRGRVRGRKSSDAFLIPRAPSSRTFSRRANGPEGSQCGHWLIAQFDILFLVRSVTPRLCVRFQRQIAQNPQCSTWNIEVNPK